MTTSSKKIIISGNKNYGVAEGINTILGSEYHLTFCSRKTGFELTNESDRKRFAELSLDHDIFINNAALWRFNQILLLEEVWKTWNDAGKKGHIINLGSTADRQINGGNWMYPAEKNALRHQSLSQAMWTLGGNPIKVTYLGYGYVKTPGVEKKHPTKNKHEPIEIAKMIKWIIEYPIETTNLIEIVLDPIQNYK
jgi:NAD(P)-dependent dehydrogenase (short-subunit alcohol dehydrogenase family)